MNNQRFVIIAAGGIGTRMGLPYPKQLLRHGNQTVIEHALDLFVGNPILVAVPETFYETFKQTIGDRASLVKGGETRYLSVRYAFEALGDIGDDSLILIHDAARPFLNTATLETAWIMAEQKGAVIYAARATDTIKRTRADGQIEETLDRDTIFHAQTPQIFRAGLLRRAYAAMDQRGGETAPTDEANLMERCGVPVHIFESEHGNRKLTRQEDLSLLQQTTPVIGHGYDVHRFDPTRPLYLGGVLIPDSPGLLGHSDADVVLHALIDALLGAAGQGDIGQWFPDTDPTWRGVRSTVLLEKVWQELAQMGYTVGNADITIQAQAPRLAPHLTAMRAAIADLLETRPEKINIKATTTEKMGFVGRKEGMAAHAVALLIGEVQS